MDDVAAARLRLPALAAVRARWLEEPFAAGALHAYAALAAAEPRIALAGGEMAGSFDAARQIIDHGRVSYIQIDAGIIGGLTTARQVVDYARQRGVSYVNHSFTSSLALAASLAPYWDWPEAELCEFPFDPSPLGRALTRQRLLPDADGLLRPPEGPGLGLRPDPAAIEQYLVPVRIEVAGQVLYGTPIDLPE
jgi:L-alanine-DL-glutamate epimerase-like enolase superfamily enzyme